VSDYSRTIIKKDNTRFRDAIGIDSPFLDKFFYNNDLKQNLVNKKVRVIQIISVSLEEGSSVVGMNNEDTSLFSSLGSSALYKIIYAEESQETLPPEDPGYNNQMASMCLGQGGGYFFHNGIITIDSLIEVEYDETDRNKPVRLVNEISSGSPISTAKSLVDQFFNKDQIPLSQSKNENPYSIEGLKLFEGKHRQDFLDINKKGKQKIVGISGFPPDQGLSSAQLREDAALSFKNFKKEVESLGGKLTSSGGLVPGTYGKSKNTKVVDANGQEHKVSCSLHYLGIAHDFAMPSGMTSIDKNFLVVYQGSKKWTVYAKTNSTSVPVMTIKPTLARSEKVNGKMRVFFKQTTYTGRLINITQLAAKYGFLPISANSNSHPPSVDYSGEYMAPQGAKYDLTEWWHFQLDSAINPGETFGSQILKIYTEEDARKQFPEWDIRKNLVYKKDFS
jgi:hypothetical protein